MDKETLLKLAGDRFSKKNKFIDRDYETPIDEFILKMYLNCDPASYGRQFVKKIMRDTHKVRNTHVYYVKDKVDMGDLVQIYPDVEFFSKKIYDNKRHKIVSWENSSKNTFEVKISYLTKNDLFNVRNIRPYQNFNYYLLCFVDCKNEFNPKFILVDKEVITDNGYFTLTPMNGTKKANQNNVDIGYGTSFKKGSYHERLLLSKNLLSGTTYDDVWNFLKTNVVKLESIYEESSVKEEVL